MTLAVAATKMRDAEPLTMAVIVLAMLSCVLLKFSDHQSAKINGAACDVNNR